MAARGYIVTRYPPNFPSPFSRAVRKASAISSSTGIPYQDCMHLVLPVSRESTVALVREHLDCQEQHEMVTRFGLTPDGTVETIAKGALILIAERKQKKNTGSVFTALLRSQREPDVAQPP